MSYTVDTQMLADAERRLEGFARHCEEQLHRVEELIASNHVRWTGDGASAYEARHTDWARNGEQMRQHIVAIKERAAVARSAYQAALEANTKMFG